MQKSQITVNLEYALREKRSPNTPFQRVRVLAHIRRNKWRVEWIDPNPGLVDYVESSQLVVLWKDRSAFLREEKNLRELKEHNSLVGYESDETPMGRALDTVFESAATGVNFYRGILSGTPGGFELLRARLGIGAIRDSSAAYTDREGTRHLPFDLAVELAQAFCAAEPSTVLLGVETTEREWETKAKHGHHHLVGLLNDYRAAWALVRQWAGHDAAVAEREETIQRLERLVWDAIYALQKAGLDREADRLRSKLGVR